MNTTAQHSTHGQVPLPGILRPRLLMQLPCWVRAQAGTSSGRTLLQQPGGVVQNSTAQHSAATAQRGTAQQNDGTAQHGTKQTC